MEEGQCRPFRSESDDRELCEEFRHPRDSVLSIAAQFWTFSSGRLRHLRKTLADPSFRFPDLLDNKSHNVSEILLPKSLDCFSQRLLESFYHAFHLFLFQYSESRVLSVFSLTTESGLP